MSDSEEEEEQYPFLGTPLEPIEEGDIPKKKPVGIQDQIATDKYGRRRFHGAFTGGFSAGHFNSVGTPEGWKPASFKSSRSTKVDSKNQRPEDFMDDEDIEDFGIAPSVVRAKSEYSGSKSTKKRERVNFQDGPIPGEPVLQKILEPSKNTVGVLLLMKMGWKPGQGIGPRLSKIEKRLQKRKLKGEKSTSVKVYGCALKSPSSSDESGSDEDLDIDTLFAPDDVEEVFAKAKTDVFGMGYSGLDRSSVLSVKQNDPSRAFPETFRLMDNNKKVAIRGQAFGVGAFEEEDADIYARDDMSQYDFALETPASLREKRKKERAAKEKLLAITGGEDVIEGFVAAKKPSAPKKYFPPPTLPPGYQPVHTARKSRFGPEQIVVPEVRGPKKALDAEDRSVILGEKSSIRKTVEVKGNEEQAEEQSVPELPPPDPEDELNFKPFVADPLKQARYEKYLQLVKIGAKDAFASLQPKNMSEWEKERERTEFEQAAKLYRPLSGMMADRFSRAELPDESLDPLAPVAKMSHGVSADMVAAAKSKMFGKLTRSVDDWAPVSLVCKRMNIAEPLNRGGRSLCEVAKDRTQPKSRFSVFDILVDSDNPFSSYSRKDSDNPASSAAAGLPPSGKLSSQTSQILDSEKPKPSVPDEISDPFEKITFDDPAEKKDLFKAIFCDSESEEEDTQAPKVAPPKPSEASQQNVLRNTSPPRGIFANLNLDKLNEKKPGGSTVQKEEPSNKDTSVDTVITLSGGAGSVPQKPTDKEGDSLTELIYGPALPTKPVFVHKHTNKTPTKPVVTSSDSSSSSSDEEEWVEKDSSSSAKKKKKKRKADRKEKKRKKKKKHKEHKEHKRKHKDKRN